MAILNVFKVAESEKAMGVIPCHCGTWTPADEKIMWIPLSKVLQSTETDNPSRNVKAGNMERVGFPYILNVDLDFLDKIGRANLAR